MYRNYRNVDLKTNKEPINTTPNPISQQSLYSTISKRLCCLKSPKPGNMQGDLGPNSTLAKEKTKINDSSPNQKVINKGKNKNEIRFVLRKLNRTTALLPKAIQSSYAYEKGKKGCDTCSMNKEMYKSFMKSAKVIELIVEDVVSKEQKELLDKEDENYKKKQNSIDAKKGEKNIAVQFEVYCRKDIDHNLKCVLIKLQKTLGDTLLQLCFCKSRKNTNDEKCKKYDVSVNVLEHMKFEYTNLTNIIIRLFKQPTDQTYVPDICVACMKEQLVDCTEILEDILKKGRNLKVTMRNENVGKDKCCSRNYPHVHAVVQDKHVVLKFDLPFQIASNTNKFGVNDKLKDNGSSHVAQYDEWPDDFEEERLSTTEQNKPLNVEDSKGDIKSTAVSKDKPDSSSLSNKSVKSLKNADLTPERPPESFKNRNSDSSFSPQKTNKITSDPLIGSLSKQENKSQEGEQYCGCNFDEVFKKTGGLQDKGDQDESVEQDNSKVNADENVDEVKIVDYDERLDQDENLRQDETLKNLDEAENESKSENQEEDEKTKQKKYKTYYGSYNVSDQKDQGSFSSMDEAENESKSENQEEDEKTKQKKYKTYYGSYNVSDLKDQGSFNSMDEAENENKSENQEEDEKTKQKKYKTYYGSYNVSDQKDKGSFNSMDGKYRQVSFDAKTVYFLGDTVQSVFQGEIKQPSMFQRIANDQDKKHVRDSKITAVDSVVLVKNKYSISENSKTSKELQGISQKHGPQQILDAEIKMADLDSKSSKYLNKQKINDMLKDIVATKLSDGLIAECCKNNKYIRDFPCIMDLPYSASLHSLPLEIDDLNDITKAVEKLVKEDALPIPDCDNEWEIEYTTNDIVKDENDNTEWHKAFTARDSNSKICIEIQTDKPVTRRRISTSPTQKEIQNLPTINEEDEEKSRSSLQSFYKSEGKGPVSKKKSSKSTELRFFTVEYPNSTIKAKTFLKKYQFTKTEPKPNVYNSTYHNHIDRYFKIIPQSTNTNDSVEDDDGYISDESYHFCNSPLIKIKSDECIKLNCDKYTCLGRSDKKLSPTLSDRLLMLDIINLTSNSNCEKGSNRYSSLNSSTLHSVPNITYKAIYKSMPLNGFSQRNLRPDTEKVSPTNDKSLNSLQKQNTELSINSSSFYSNPGTYLKCSNLALSNSFHCINITNNYKKPMELKNENQRKLIKQDTNSSTISYSLIRSQTNIACKKFTKRTSSNCFYQRTNTKNATVNFAYSVSNAMKKNTNLKRKIYLNKQKNKRIKSLRMSCQNYRRNSNSFFTLPENNFVSFDGKNPYFNISSNDENLFCNNTDCCVTNSNSKISIKVDDKVKVIGSKSINGGLLEGDKKYDYVPYSENTNSISNILTCTSSVENNDSSFKNGKEFVEGNFKQKLELNVEIKESDGFELKQQDNYTRENFMFFNDGKNEKSKKLSHLKMKNYYSKNIIQTSSHYLNIRSYSISRKSKTTVKGKPKSRKREIKVSCDNQTKMSRSNDLNFIDDKKQNMSQEFRPVLESIPLNKQHKKNLKCHNPNRKSYIVSKNPVTKITLENVNALITKSCPHKQKSTFIKTGTDYKTIKVLIEKLDLKFPRTKNIKSNHVIPISVNTSRNHNVLSENYTKGDTEMRKSSINKKNNSDPGVDSIVNFDFQKDFIPEKAPFSTMLKILSPQGDPLSLYDFEGLRLTSTSGTMLVNSQGEGMLKFDSAGNPISDFRGNPIFYRNSKPVIENK